MNTPTIAAGRVTIAQCEDGSLVATIKRTGSGSRIIGTVAVPAQQLERWVLRLMRAELLPIRDVLPQTEEAA